MSTATKPPRKVRPVTITIEGELAEKVRSGAREVGFRADKWAAMLIGSGDIMSSGTDEAKEFRVEMALRILHDEGFVGVRALPAGQKAS